MTASHLGIKLLTYFNFLFLGLLLLVVLYAGLFPAQHKFGLYESPIPIFVAAVAVVASLAWLTEKAGSSQALRRNYRYLVVAGFAASIAIQLVVAHALKSDGYTWDSNIVLSQAINYAEAGQIDPGIVSYFAVNPNNIALLAGLGVFFRTLSDFGVQDYLSAAILLNVLLMSIAQILTFLTVKLLYGRRIAAISMIFSFIFISLTMYVQIPYTDTLTVVFPILLLYMTLRIARTNRTWLRIVLSGLLGAAAWSGYLIKPTVIVAFLAIVLAAAVGFLMAGQALKRRRSWAIALACSAACAVGLLGTQLAYVKAVDGLHIVPFSVTKTGETSKPLIHFMSMGMKTTVLDNTVNYGGYNDDEAAAITNILDKDDKTTFSINNIKRRLADYGPLGYVNFLAHKANWILADATFFAYGEGSNEDVTFRNQDAVSRFLRSFMFIGGSWYILFGNILQIFWIALLILITMQLIIMIMDKSSRTKMYALMPRLMIAGILLFLLLFEGRSRYLFLYIPIFIVAAMYTLQWFKPVAAKQD